MNKFVALVCLMAACALAAPSSPAQEAARRVLPALHHEEIHDEFGQYALRYVTAEGTVVEERGRLVPTPDGADRVLIYDGETTHVGPDGKAYVTKYSAGFDGFKVEGDHLPKAPEAEPLSV